MAFYITEHDTNPTFERVVDITAGVLLGVILAVSVYAWLVVNHTVPAPAWSPIGSVEQPQHTTPVAPATADITGEQA